MNTSKRLDYLDMAKGFGMLFVLMGHLQGDTIFSLSPYFHKLCVFIFAFHMPLFFIISGILMCNKDSQNTSEISGNSSLKINTNGSIKSHISRRFKGIMVPYLWFSLFYFLVVIYAFIKGSIAYQTVLINLWYILSCYGMNVLWFLPALFFGEIIFIFIKNRFSEKSINIIIPVISVISYVLAYLMTLGNYDFEYQKRLHELGITLVRPFIACSWIYIGYMIHKYLPKFKIPVLSDSNIASSKSRIANLFIGAIFMILCAVLSTINNGVDLRSLVLRNVFFYILCSLLGSYGLIMICKGLPSIKLVKFWGTGSLIFMAVHNSETVLFYALKVSMYVNQFLTHARGYICYLIILSIILLYTSIMIFVIQKFFPFILGKPFLHKTLGKSSGK